MRERRHRDIFHLSLWRQNQEVKVKTGTFPNQSISTGSRKLRRNMEFPTFVWLRIQHLFSEQQQNQWGKKTKEENVNVSFNIQTTIKSCSHYTFITGLILPDGGGVTGDISRRDDIFLKIFLRRPPENFKPCFCRLKQESKARNIIFSKQQPSGFCDST